jgi:hypothetical protein
MAACRRCAECRKTFTPARSARSTQRVCSKACRKRRDRKLARARRRRDLDDARIDDRARQRVRREHLAAKCHAPASPRKCPLSPKEMRQFVDRALARSRASLLRDLRGMLLRFAPIRGEGGTTSGAMSRATLGAQDSDTVADSGANLAEPSHTSLGDRTAP